jgi:hypothetical protein
LTGSLGLINTAENLGRHICFGLFGDFIPKGENVRPKKARFQGHETKGGECEHRKRRSKRGKFDLGGV